MAHARSAVALALVSHAVRLRSSPSVWCSRWSPRSIGQRERDGSTRSAASRASCARGWTHGLPGIERQVLRAGGQLTATPWWALLAYVVGAALLIAAVDGAIGARAGRAGRVRIGARSGVLFLLIRWTFAFLRLALIVRVVRRGFRDWRTRAGCRGALAPLTGCCAHFAASCRHSA